MGLEGIRKGKSSFKVCSFEKVKASFQTLGDRIKAVAARISEFFKDSVAPTCRGLCGRAASFLPGHKKQKPNALEKIMKIGNPGLSSDERYAKMQAFALRKKPRTAEM